MWRRLKYVHRIKRLGKTPPDSGLVRADKNKIKESLMQQKRTTDVIPLPFVFPTGPQNQRRYIIHDKFYCIFPPCNTNHVKSLENEEVVKRYGQWLTQIKGDDSILVKFNQALQQKDTRVVHSTSVTAFNHFFVSNKFVLGGYVLNETTATLVYHRTLPVDSHGIHINPNIFCLTESEGDRTTAAEVYNVWKGESPSSISAAIQSGGCTTNITDIPLDKTMYGIVTCDIKTKFHEQQEHMELT